MDVCIFLISFYVLFDKHVFLALTNMAIPVMKVSSLLYHQCELFQIGKHWMQRTMVFKTRRRQLCEKRDAAALVEDMADEPDTELHIINERHQ